MKSKRGFSLIELLVVVLIIGILTSMALPGYEKARRKALFVQVQSDLKYLMETAEEFTMANGYVTGEIPLNRPDWKSCTLVAGERWECKNNKVGEFELWSGTEQTILWIVNTAQFKIAKNRAIYAFHKKLGEPWKWGTYRYDKPEKDETTKMMCDWWGDKPKEAYITGVCS